MKPDASKKAMRDRVAGDSRRGDREYQEDAFKVIDLRECSTEDDDAVLLVLADGMGGHAGGALASEIAVNRFAEAYVEMMSSPSLMKRFERSLEAVNLGLQEAIAEKPHLKGMGCTLIAAVVENDRLVWISIGDSPFWLYRNGTLTRLNADHSMKPVLEAMVAAGELTDAEARQDGRRSALRSAVDGNTPHLVDLNINGYRLQPEDTIILASDGVESMSDEEIAYALDRTSGRGAGERVTQLLDAVIAKRSPGQDNTTAILLEVILSEDGLAATADVTRLNPGSRLPRAVEIERPDPEEVRPGKTQVPDDAKRRPVLASLIIAGLAIVLAVIFGVQLLNRGESHDAVDAAPSFVREDNLETDRLEEESSDIEEPRSPDLFEEPGEGEMEVVPSDGTGSGQGELDDRLGDPDKEGDGG